MNERLIGSQAKVARARKHLGDLTVTVRAYLDTQPFVVATKRDPDTRQLIYYLAEVRDLPIDIPVIAGDVLQCLRSSLDYLAYQLVHVGTSGKGPFRHVYFPIADSAEKYLNIKSVQTKGMDPEALRAIGALKPYKGGNDLLWQLHELNRLEKHRVLVTAGSTLESADLGSLLLHEMGRSLGYPLGVTMPAFFRPADRLFPLRAGVELLITLPDSEVYENMSFKFGICLNEPGVIENMLLLETLQQMVNMVDTLIAGFDRLLI